MPCALLVVEIHLSRLPKPFGSLFLLYILLGRSFFTPRVECPARISEPLIVDGDASPEPPMLRGDSAHLRRALEGLEIP